MKNFKAIYTNKDIRYEIQVKQSTFPAGERYLKIEEESLHCIGQHLQEDKSGFIVVHPLSASCEATIDCILFSNAMSEYFEHLCPQRFISFAYLPYGRQDRVCSKGESFSLKVFLNMIAPYYEKISICDVHNEPNTKKIIDANPYLQGKVSFEHVIYTPEYFINVVGSKKIDSFSQKTTCVVIVDDGATQRCTMAMEALGLTHYIKYAKERKDGKVFSVFQEANCSFDEITDFIVFDDICDGGATFLKTAENLNTLCEKASKTLVVTHGIFSAGLENLKKQYHHIFVYNTDYNLNRLEALN